MIVCFFPPHHRRHWYVTHITHWYVGQSHRLHCEKGPAEADIPSPAEEVQPAPGTAETVLLCHPWIHPLHINNCLVRLSYQIWPQKTTKGSTDCWANHWYNPPHSPRTVLNQSEQKGWQNYSGPSHPAHSLFELLPSGRRLREETVPVSGRSELCSVNQTQEQFLPSGRNFPSSPFPYLSNTHT